VSTKIINKITQIVLLVKLSLNNFAFEKYGLGGFLNALKISV